MTKENELVIFGNVVKQELPETEFGRKIYNLYYNRYSISVVIFNDYMRVSVRYQSEMSSMLYLLCSETFTDNRSLEDVSKIIEDSITKHQEKRKITENTVFHLLGKNVNSKCKNNDKDYFWSIQKGDYVVDIDISNNLYNTLYDKVVIICAVKTPVTLGFKEILHKIIDNDLLPEEIEFMVKTAVYNYVHRNDEVIRWAQI
jgi:hypothetical protein